MSFIFVVSAIVADLAQVASAFLAISKRIGIRNGCRQKSRCRLFTYMCSFMSVVTLSRVSSDVASVISIAAGRMYFLHGIFLAGLEIRRMLRVFLGSMGRWASGPGISIGEILITLKCF